MANFDSFERYFKSALAGEISIRKSAELILALDESNKVHVVKQRTYEEVMDFLFRAQEALVSFFPEGCSFSSNDNNQDGKDLLEISTKTHIELKSGSAMTDANSGLAIVSWALSDDEGLVKKIMKGGLEARRSLLLKNANAVEIQTSKDKTMDQLAELFRSKAPLGPASDRLAHFFRSVAVGFTKSQEILVAFEKAGPSKTPLLLEANWDAGLSLYEKAFLPDEDIVVVKVERTQGRAQIVAQGKTTGRVARLYPNYKNSWKAPSGRKYEASNWVHTPCFHVWVDNGKGSR